MVKTLRQVIQEADAAKRAIGHFNISDIAALKAIFEAAKELNVPVIIGVSEGEREFIDIHEAFALVKGLREEHDYPIYLNADHTYSLEKVKEAVAAGVDAVIFDGAKLSFAENVAKTKEVVEYVKAEAQKQNREILVEGELGYIGTSSKILTELPAGAALSPEMFTKPEEAAQFVKETGVDLLAPAVGNIHGMIGVGLDPALDIPRIAAIRAACGVPLVLHGGSGSKDVEFVKSAQNGMAIIHINTEIRKAWREGIESALKENPGEVTPYKLLAGPVAAVKAVVLNRLKLFSGL
jgi:fructose-bisphosphate aldolase, class II